MKPLVLVMGSLSRVLFVCLLFTFLVSAVLFSVRARRGWVDAPGGRYAIRASYVVAKYTPRLHMVCFRAVVTLTAKVPIDDTHDGLTVANSDFSLLFGMG